MKRFLEKLEEKMLPAVAWVQSNKYLSAIQYGMTCLMPLLMVGAFCCVISDLPIQAYQNFMAGIFGDFWYVWNWNYVNVVTIGISGLVALVAVTYELARQDKVSTIPAVIISLSSYFMLLAYTEDGTGFATAEFSASNLFVALIVAIVSESIYAACIKKKVVIKMPESVPAFVSQQFAAVIPACITTLLFLAVRVAVMHTSFGTVSSMIYTILQAPLANMGTSYIGTLICTILNSLIWMFGIHGTNVVFAVWLPLWQAARSANLEVFMQSADAVRPYITTDSFGDMIIFLTGTGLTLPLVLEMIFICKSQRLKAVGKTSLIPGIFNVNEPVIFGLPIVLNPVMLIPFILSPVVCVSIAYFTMKTGIVPRPTGVPVPWTMPAPFGGVMMTNSLAGGILQIVILFISGVIYYPFIKVLDRQYMKEEIEDHKLETDESGK